MMRPRGNAQTSENEFSAGWKVMRGRKEGEGFPG